MSALLLGITLNSKLKYICYDSLDKSGPALFAIIFKTFQSASSIFISYNAMRYFDVSTTSIVTSLTPLIACLLAWMLLGEHISSYTIFAVCVVLSCVLMIILGSGAEE
jgi:drug/metabolite transporter (DMT)-like permease